ncbi:MAG: heme biosynthesis protein HemY [Gammaproteobacteria bacterium]|nr:heme biosynthesis protein HemY [Gammaproteobacteria bacterium]
MKMLLYIIAVLTVVVIATLAAIEDPGYVLITRAPFSIELSLTFFVVLFAVSFVAVYALLRLIINGLRLPAQVTQWNVHRLKHNAQRNQSIGLMQLIQGDWQKAERNLIAHASDSDTPVINYLGAAMAAQELGHPDNRDRYLALAHEHAPKQRLAIDLTQASLQQRGEQTEQALATLTRLHETAPKNSRVLKLLVSVYRQLRDWKGIASLLKALRKSRAYTAKELQQLEIDTYQALLAHSGNSDIAPSAQEVWQNAIPRSLQSDPALLTQYINRLIDSGDMETADRILRKNLNKKWDSQLIYLFGLIEAPDPGEQLKYAEKCLHLHPYSSNLLLTLGRLAMRNQIWGRARSYLESAIASSSLPEAYNELGHLLEHLGESEQALECYRKGLETVTKHQTKLDPATAGVPSAPVKAMANGASGQ